MTTTVTMLTDSSFVISEAGINVIYDLGEYCDLEVLGGMPLHAAVFSHQHSDHCDPSKLPNNEIPVFGPADTMPRFSELGFTTNILTLGTATKVLNNTVVAYAVDHGTTSTPIENFGYAITTNNGVRVWFAGDTKIDATEIPEGRFDVVILPIGGTWVLDAEGADEYLGKFDGTFVAIGTHADYAPAEANKFLSTSKINVTKFVLRPGEKLNIGSPTVDLLQRSVVLLLEEISDRNFSDESVTLAAPTVELELETGKYAYFLVDVVLDASAERRIRLIEANGSNAAGSSAHDGDLPRVDHMVATMLGRSVPGKVAIIAHQGGTPCVGEIAIRAAYFGNELAKRTGESVDIVQAGKPANKDGYTVVRGSIEELQDHLDVENGVLLYLGEPVSFVSNGNVIPALQRLGKELPNLEVIHEGRAVEITLDKAAQQRFCEAAGMAELKTFEANTIVAAVDFVVAHPELAFFVKIKGGSGAAGVVGLPPGVSAESASALIAAGLAKAEMKYSSLASAFPLTIVEDAETALLQLGDAEYRWDGRVEVMVYPDRIVACPLSVRRCAVPFDGSFLPETVVVNLTGTADGNERVMPFIDVMSALGDDPAFLLDRISTACAKWAAAAVAPTE